MGDKDALAFEQKFEMLLSLSVPLWFHQQTQCKVTDMIEREWNF